MSLVQQAYITPTKNQSSRHPLSEGENQLIDKDINNNQTATKLQKYKKVKSPRSTMKPNLNQGNDDNQQMQFQEQILLNQHNEEITSKKEIMYMHKQFDEEVQNAYQINQKQMYNKQQEMDEYAVLYNNSNILKSKNDLDNLAGIKDNDNINSLNNDLRLSNLKSDDIIQVPSEQNEQVIINNQIDNLTNQQNDYEENNLNNNESQRHNTEQNCDKKCIIEKNYSQEVDPPTNNQEMQLIKNEKDEDNLINQYQSNNTQDKEIYQENENQQKINQGSRPKKKNQFEEMPNTDLELIAFDLESEQHKSQMSVPQGQINVNDSQHVNYSQSKQYKQQQQEINNSNKNSNRNIQINKDNTNINQQLEIIPQSSDQPEEIVIIEQNIAYNTNINEKKSVRFMQQKDEIDPEIDNNQQNLILNSKDSDIHYKEIPHIQNINQQYDQQNQLDQSMPQQILSDKKELEIEIQPDRTNQILNKSSTQIQNQQLKIKNNIFHSNYRTGIPTISKKDRINYYNQTPGFDESDNVKGLINNSSLLSKGGQENQVPMIQALVNELDKIDQHANYKKETEQFIILFNKNPEDGIKYLIANNIKQPIEIAHCLMTTQGLSKQKLGDLFASPKPQNQQIMEEYCKLLDFKDLKLGDAIRYFLKSFKLPGESQQIERVITIFSKHYMEDNPQAFNDEDTPFIIVYSAIMLNVSAHNSQIDSKDRMTKKQFVDNTKICCVKTQVSVQFLEELYDNIVKEKFETHESLTEQVYARMVASLIQGKGEKLLRHQRNSNGSGFANNSNDGSQSCVMHSSNYRYLQNQLLALKVGSNFLKYGRKGDPHTRRVFLSEDETKICWQNYTVIQTLNKLPSQKNPIKLNQSQLKEKLNEEDKKQEQIQQSNIRYILVSEIIDIALGCTTTEVFRKNNVPKEFDPYCFSLIAKSRTLDLKTDDKQQMDYWVNYFFSYLIKKREENSRKIMIKRRNNENKEKISEIWRVDIFPKWEEHWDYNNHRPQNLYKIQEIKKKKKSNSLFDGICSCFKQRKTSQNQGGNMTNNVNSSLNQFEIHPSFIQNHKNYTETQFIGQEEFDIETKNKSLLLIMLWRIGIPDWVRKTLWPLAIGNRIEISESLYKKLLIQYKFLQNNKMLDFDPQCNTFLTQMENEIQKYFDKQGHLQTFLINQTYFPLQKKDSLRNILGAFILFRSDLGYVQQKMIYLGAILLHFLEEYYAFQCFVNIIYSYHFINVFNVREVGWRLQFFNDNFQRRLPLVYQHFNSLDMPSETFLIPWMLTLFANSISDVDIISRIWDNFFLEGELFFYKASLAIIEFFQLELKTSTFKEAINLLQNIPLSLTEEYLFDIIEDIKIPTVEFSKLLEKQQKAHVNNQIFKALL